jgi:phosphonate transport system ATP-binding protein
LNNVLMGRLGAISAFKSIFNLYPPQDIANAYNSLKLVGIGDKAELRADQLSGGQQQRVAIARALAQNPDLLLADEPVASLDPATAHTVMNYLKQVNQELGITVICNLHFLSLVREYATRVIALREGEVVFKGDPKEINEDWFKKIYGESAKDIYVR